MIQTFKRKSQPVRAVQWQGTNLDEVAELIPHHYDKQLIGPQAKFLYVFTGIGRKVVAVGDWIVEPHGGNEAPAVHCEEGFKNLFTPA